MNIFDLHARISQFVENYGGQPPKSNDKKSLDMISDFLLVIEAEIDFKVRNRLIMPAQPVERPRNQLSDESAI